ncbi:MAG: hypothetical protein JW866_05300 [Ignavibacteriales bacterium]|nr:hypothetical protein [Ignavibacteriales bacterium]
MENIIITLPKRRLKLKAKNITEAISKLKELNKDNLSKNLRIVEKYFGMFKPSKKINKTDWYEQ